MLPAAPPTATQLLTICAAAGLPARANVALRTDRRPPSAAAQPPQTEHVPALTPAECLDVLAWACLRACPAAVRGTPTTWCTRARGRRGPFLAVATPAGTAPSLRLLTALAHHVAAAGSAADNARLVVITVIAVLRSGRSLPWQVHVLDLPAAAARVPAGAVALTRHLQRTAPRMAAVHVVCAALLSGACSVRGSGGGGTRPSKALRAAFLALAPAAATHLDVEARALCIGHTFCGAIPAREAARRLWDCGQPRWRVAAALARARLFHHVADLCPMECLRADGPCARAAWALLLHGGNDAAAAQWAPIAMWNVARGWAPPANAAVADAGDPCCVCLEVAPRKPMARMRCGHRMHAQCLFTWAEVCMRAEVADPRYTYPCPMCRAPACVDGHAAEPGAPEPPPPPRVLAGGVAPPRDGSDFDGGGSPRGGRVALFDFFD
jgi:hypothetical protein